jgi:hypothetical protein
MVKKDLTLRHALLALVITIAVFVVGGLLGYSLNIEKSRMLTEQVQTLQSDMESIQLSLLYVDALGPEHSCGVMQAEVTRATGELNDLGKRLQSYQDAEDFGTDFFMLKDQYSFLELRTWLFYKKLRENCATDTVDVVYFFSSHSCEGCIGQGKVLDNMKRSLGDRLLVFSLDTEWDQPIMKAFMQDFGVSQAPALVVNGKKHGYLEDAEFQQVLCGEYTDKPSFC